MSEETLKILMGSSIERPEEELDDNVDVIKDAELQYSYLEIINSIGKSDFKQVYDLFKNDVFNSSAENQRHFCREVLEKYKEEYEIDFSIGENIPVEDIYKFMEFIEYDYINFISNIWKTIGTPLRNLDIENFCRVSGDKIIKIVEDQIESYFFNELISTFLRTYIKELFIDMFINWTIKSKMEIILKIEGE